MPQDDRSVRVRAPRARGRAWAGAPGWVGRLVLAGAASGVVLVYGAHASQPAADPRGAGAPAAPAVLVAGAALGGGSLSATPTVRSGAATAPGGAAPGAAAAAPAGDTTPRVVAAANAFLASLTDSQRVAASFAFDDTTAKAQWSNLPRGLFGWVGVRMGDLSAAQQQSAMDLLRVTLSPQGYQRVLASVNADEVLKGQSGNNPLQFGAENYFVAVFGTPSNTAPWMFRFGGHHITVNATVVGPNIAITPSFPGCQPCEYASSGQTLRVTGDVTDRAFGLVGALDATQQAQAVLGAQPIDLVLGPNQPMRIIPPEGIKASALTAPQQALLVDLIGQYVGLLNPEDAALKQAEVRSTLADTYFAWSGPTTAGSVAYFRIQGPALWIEYSPQNVGQGGGLTGGQQGGPPGADQGGPPGTGQGGPPGDQQGGQQGGGAVANPDANHVHAIFRDPTNEYGARWLPG